MDPQIEQLQRLIAAQGRRIESLERAATRPVDVGFNPQFPVFIAARTGDGALTFQEQVPVAGVLTDADADKSRRCTDDADASAIIRLSPDGVILLAIPDPDDGSVKTRFIEIASGDTGGCFWARITGDTQDGSNKRWTYTFEEVEKTVASFGGWTTKTDGRSGDAFNTIEDLNGASGLYGNGVNSANLAGTGLDIQPITTGDVVWLRPVRVIGGGVEYHFEADNGVDGPCEEE